MSTLITLDDGRILGLSNGLFDAIIEVAAAQLRDRDDAIDGLAEWLLDQRCLVMGPGVGYLDVRELSPQAAADFRWACGSALESVRTAGGSPEWLYSQLALMGEMWASIDRGEPPEALTDPDWQIDWERLGFAPQGPGWTQAEVDAWRKRYGVLS